MNRILDVATSLGVTIARAANGVSVGPLGRRPEQPLDLYDFEGCPFCRKVRETLSTLDLDARVFPCPKGGTRFRAHVIEKGGKAQFPWLEDPNTGKAMYESGDIVTYLYETYGAGTPPLVLSNFVVMHATSGLAAAFRPVQGIRVEPSTPPAKPLELWSFEASPFCRIAREKLCTLEIPYLLHNVAKGSPKRDAFVARSGKMMVPYLADPNTGVEMFESADIVAYLDRTYGKR
jgi:glutathione S-transferase